MMPFLTPYIAEVRARPAEFFVGLCVLFVAVMGTSVNHVASTSYSFLLLAGLFVVLSWPSTWRQLEGGERWMLAGFVLYAFSGVISLLNVQDIDEYIKDLERYLRYLLAVPMYLYLRRYRVSAIRYLYAGAILSGPFLFAVAMMSYLESPDLPARGYYHHIIFGSLAMLNVGVMLSMLLTMRLSVLYRALIVLSILCGITAAVLSQSRGAWLVLPLYALVVLYMAYRHSVRRLVVVLASVMVVALLFSMTPAKDVIDRRISAAVDEVTGYYENGRYATSVGQRLVMWEIAIEHWKEHPFIGIGPGDFDDVVMDLQSKGRYVGMEVHASTHNIYMQGLVGTGLFGLIALLAGLIILPLRNMIRAGDSTTQLTGVMVILSFAVFGISESWTLRLSIISVYIIYCIVIISSIFSSRDEAG